MAKDTGDKTRGNIDNLQKPWQPGQSGNPAGRPKSVKNMVTEKFLRDLHTSWEANGKKALDALLEKDVASYVRVVAAMVPKEFTINEGETSLERIVEQLTDADLADAISGLSTLGADAAKRKLKEIPPEQLN